MSNESDISQQMSLPAQDTRAAAAPHTLDTPRTFPKFSSLAEWQARREFIRRQILVSCGLYPLPPKTPLHIHIFGRIERDGYSIEKVYFQIYPSFYLAGNLYRPLKAEGEKGRGGEGERHPGVLVAHGHWPDGRMADSPDGSIAARAITFARQGYVAFSYDMVGYNDTRQIAHDFANDRRHWLWGVSLMGLQTWNSIRALDFLASLPDVDSSRLAITGESGGGTQTMMLGAIDDRLAAVGPCVMVSHSMQGGCLCENAPGLRIEFSNMEIAAAVAPRPQIMVGATGDWTKTMMTVEGPAAASVYKLYGKSDNLKYVIFDYGHNINKTSREAVYRFFGAHLLHRQDADQLEEPPYRMEPVADLRVFPDNTPLQPDARNADALTADLIALAKSQLEQHKPHDKESLAAFQRTYQPAWEHTLGVEIPPPGRILTAEAVPVRGADYLERRVNLGRAGRGDNIPAKLFSPIQGGVRAGVVIAHPDGLAALMEPGTRKPGPLVRALLAQGRSVLLLDAFLTGERADPQADAVRDPFAKFFTTYNRTDLQERVQDLITACAFMHKEHRSVTLVGIEKAGLWALLAAPAADAVAADCAQLDLSTDDALLANDLFIPCLRHLGDFGTAATLAAPHPLLLHNTGAHFSAAAWIEDVYRSLNAADSLQIETAALDDTALARWLATHT